MLRNVLILLALAAIVGLPFAFKPKNSLLADADETLVVITPHNEAIRYEFARGFRDWYKARTGRTVRLAHARRYDRDRPLSRQRVPVALRVLLAQKGADALDRQNRALL